MNIKEKQEAFKTIALPHKNTLYHFALRMTKNKGDADDLVQETFVRAFCNWEKFEIGTNCKSWLCTIMTHIFINSRRSNSRLPDFVLIDEVDNRSLVSTHTAYLHIRDQEQNFLAKTLNDEINKAIDTLPDIFKTVTILSFINELSYHDIAQITKLPIGTIKSRIFRSRGILQRKLRKYSNKD